MPALQSNPSRLSWRGFRAEADHQTKLQDEQISLQACDEANQTRNARGGCAVVRTRHGQTNAHKQRFEQLDVRPHLNGRESLC